MNMFLKKIETMAAAMPDTVLSEGANNYGPVTTTSAANGSQAGLVNSATGAAGALAGWAIASLGKQMSSTETHSSMSAAPNTSLAPPSASTSNYASPNNSAIASPRLSIDSDSFFGATGSTAQPSGINVKKAAPRVPSSSSGMKLGGVKAKSSVPRVEDIIADEWQDAEDNGVESAWGNDDLIDVNADTDDWAAFESAPVPEIVVPPAQSYYVNPPSQAGSNGAGKVSPQKAQPVKPPVKTSIAKPISKPSPVPSPAPAVPADDGWGEIEPSRSETASPALSAGTAAQPSLSGMSKEEKDKEMARRREERKAVSLCVAFEA
jgi:SCY1-like protein 1